MVEVIQDQSREIEAEIIDEMTQISTDWHSLLVKLNQFISESKNRLEEFVNFVDKVTQLSDSLFKLKEDIQTEANIVLPTRGSQEYARAMVDRRAAQKVINSAFLCVHVVFVYFIVKPIMHLRM